MYKKSPARGFIFRTVYRLRIVFVVVAVAADVSDSADAVVVLDSASALVRAG